MKSGEMTLAEEDVRAIVRLLGVVCGIAGVEAMRARLMDGVMELTGTRAWVWTLCAKMEPGKLPVYAGYQQGGFDEAAFEKFMKIQTHPDMAALTAPYAAALAESTTPQVTRSLQQLVTRGEFEATAVNELWIDCGFQPRLLTCRNVGGAAWAGFALYRHPDEPLLTDREALIGHVVATEISWLFEMGWPEDRGAMVPDLSPRCWLVHEMILQGYEDGRIAEVLGISEHTVRDYVKTIFRHFGVNSRAEVVARFFVGDGGDR